MEEISTISIRGIPMGREQYMLVEQCASLHGYFLQIGKAFIVSISGQFILSWEFSSDRAP